MLPKIDPNGSPRGVWGDPQGPTGTLGVSEGPRGIPQRVQKQRFGLIVLQFFDVFLDENLYPKLSFEALFLASFF